MNPDPSYNNYQIFKFEKLASDRYALKTMINDKYCEINTDNYNEIVCNSDIITRNAQFSLNKTSDGKYNIKGSDNEKYCLFNDSSKNITCNSSNRSEKSNFSIEKRVV